MSIGSLATAKSYLCASDDGFWKWSENGEAVEIDDGATIAFRSQLSHLVAAFGPAGLPPFELIIVTLAACRSPLTGWPQAFLRELSHLGTLRRSTGHWADFIDELTRLPTLPTSIRSTMPGLQAIVKLAVEGVRRTPENTSESVKQILISQEMVAEHIAGLTISRSLSDRARDLVQLGRNLRHVTEDNVRRLMTTGHVDLPRPIEPEEIVLPDPEPVVEPPTAAALTPVELLKELQRHEQHATTVRLVKEIRAAIAIPRRIVPGDDLGLGGVSDLINRGELDRLLLSELAQDDDVLMIRVALREALYLRREAPPSPPADARALLVDQGLRLWGQPRFLAAAVMLAFMVEHESLGGLNLFRSVRHELQSFTAQSTAEYEEQIAALDPALHCGAAIPDFADACRENRWEPIIITSDDAYADESFRRPLREAGFGTCYVAVVERGGRLRLISRSERGEKVLRTAVFDLERRAENTVLPARRREAADPNRPAILKRNPFPLHLSCDQPSAQKLLPLSEFHRAGVVGLTGDRRLVFWEDLSSGGPRQIFDRLPGGALHWWGFGQPDRDELLLVMGEPSHGSVHLVRASLVPGGDCDVAELGPAEGLRAVTYFQDRFYLIRQSDIEVFEVADGRWLNSTAIPPGIHHHRDRFFRSQQFTWLAMSFDGDSVRFDELGFPSAAQKIFDCEALGSPVAIDYQGRVFVSGSKEPRQAIPKSAAYLLTNSVTRDGRQVRFQGNTSPAKEWLLTFPDFRVIEDPPPAPKATAIPQLRNVLHKLTQIGVADGALSFRTKSGRWMSLGYQERPRRPGMKLLPVKHESSASLQVFEVDILRSQGYGYSVRPAKFQDGSRIFLDSRGLLHFQSSDRALPEFSLVLDDEPAGWVADGRVWGNPWYLGPSKSVAVDAAEIWKELIVPFVARLA